MGKVFALEIRKQAVEVSIVMPCLNEAETLLGCIQEAARALVAAAVRGEIVIADNGSSDGSQAIAWKAGARVVDVPDKGYGNALMGGIRAAKGTYILMADADGSYDFGVLPSFLHALRQGADLVMGCRLPKGGGEIQAGAMPWLHRWIGNPVLSNLGKFFFNAPVDDFHCGLRAFRQAAILNLNLKSSGMEFASEMVVRSVVTGLKIAQIPITLRPDGRSRKPHLRSWQDGWRHLRFMLLYTPKWLFFVPGLVLTLLGMIGFLALLAGPVKVGGVAFDTNTLLVCSAAILVGFQTLSFALYAEAFAIREGLLPPDPRLEKIIEGHPVEWGIGIGLCLLALGAIYLLFAVDDWRQLGFGNLPAQSLRVVIPAVTAIALGTQFVFAGFALAVLHLGEDAAAVRHTRARSGQKASPKESLTI